jgi:hypothetical protein
MISGPLNFSFINYFKSASFLRSVINAISMAHETRANKLELATDNFWYVIGMRDG